MPSLAFTPILLGGDQNVYGMARSIHELYGMCSYSVARIHFPVTKNTKILHCISVDQFDQAETFVSTLRQMAERFPEPRLLISCGDNYTALLSRCREQLQDLYCFNVPKTELIERLCEKDSFYRTCEENHMKYPKTCICTYEDHKQFANPFAYPVIVKAADSVSYWKCSFPGKKKVFLASDAKELEALTAAVYSSQYRQPLIVQEYIPGADDCMRVVNAYCKKGGGVRFLSLGHIILEEHTAQGIGSYAAIMGGNDDEFCHRVKEFLERIGYEGYVNIDIKRDPRTGEYNFFEINPRQGRSSYFVTASGHNLAKFIVEDLILREDHPFEIGHGQCVWSIIPKGIIKRYVSDPRVKKEIAQQIKQGGFIRHLDYKKDRALKRRLAFFLNQIHYYKKYKNNFNKKGFFS